MKTLNTNIKALALIAGLTTGVSAFASSAVTFDPTGTPGAAGNLTIGALDQSPGNALAIGASANSAVGSSFALAYQSNLGTANNTAGNAIYLNGSTGTFFTFVAGFNETITGNTINTATGQGTLTFGFGANTAGISATNYFYMYAMAAPGDNLGGTGFVGTNAILTGHFTGAGYSSAFTASGIANPPNLDNFGTNNYPGVSTILGAGSTVATLVIDSFATNYFPDLVVGATSSLINTSQNLAFNQVDPSARFSSNGLVGANIGGVSSVGAVNGISGPNTIFQADANQSFTVPTAVPEPMPAALLGIGLVAFGLARRRVAKKN